MTDQLRFHTTSAPILATVSVNGPNASAPGMRIRIDMSPVELQTTYAAGAFDLATMIPGGDVPGIAPDVPVTLELRLRDEYEALLARSSWEHGTLLGDMVGLTQTNPGHLLLDAASWQVTAVIQPGERVLHYTTLHDTRPSAPI